MNLITEVYEEDVINTSGKLDYFNQNWKLRKAARTILRKDNELAVLFVAKNKYHKLPGGGIEYGEDIQKALEREIMEETGCIAEVKKEVGITIEYRFSMKLLQISYVYESIFKEDTKSINLTEKELSQGLTLKWFNLDEVIDLFSKDIPMDESGKFISKRDRDILYYYLKLSK